MTDLHAVVPSPAKPLVQGIQDALREAITEGALAPGFRLREIPLSRHFGCSTTPVREALRRLENEGLVVVHPRRGAEVTSLDDHALQNLYETRLILECHGVRGAVNAKPSKDDLQTLDEMLARAEGLLKTDELHLVNSLDLEFHAALSRLSGNDVLADLVERVSRQVLVVRVRANARVPGGPERAHRHHKQILAAVRVGDPDRAESLMRKHIEWSEQAVAASLAKSKGDGSK